MENKIQKPVLPPVPKRIAVLMGGWTVERDISIDSGKGAIAALKSLGHEVVAIDPSPDLEEFIQQLKTCFQGTSTGTADGGYPDVVFNALHGPWGESGQCQAILESLRLPFTHSNSLASAVAMDKRMTRLFAKSVGVRTPTGAATSIGSYKQNGFQIYPHMLKPIDSVSSYGITFVKDVVSWREAAERWDCGTYGRDVLIEEYIPGKELTVAVFGGQPMGVLDVRYGHDLYDVTTKYVEGEAEYIVPAPIHPDIYAQAMEWSTTMHESLKCSGITRSDFRYDDTTGEPGLLYFLEINTQPGLTLTSLSPKIAKQCHGWSYDDLVQWLVNDALERNKKLILNKNCNIKC